MSSRSDTSDHQLPESAEDTMDEDTDFEYDDDLDEDDDDQEEIQIDDMQDEQDDEDADNDVFDDEDFAGAGDDAFTNDIPTGKNKLKTFQVEFKCHSIDSLKQQQDKEVDHVASMFSIKDTDAAILLRHFAWNKERLIEKYMDEPEKVNLQAGIVDGPTRPRIQSTKDFTCTICYMSSSDNDDGLMNTLALGCGHRFCTDCYQQYVEQKVKQEGESRSVQCMQEKCALVLDEKTVELIVTPDIFERYKTLLNRTYVDDSSIFRWCPAPNCQNAVECHVSARKLRTVVPSVVCDCGHPFCFGCGNASHAPAICALVKQWLKKCEDDSETANWISANTKECPECSSTIEKNGGCNHMTCRKCRHEWCWICEGPWSEHGSNWYNCNRFDEKSSVNARDAQAKSRASLERYLHYFNRFANHEQSLRLDIDLYHRIEKKMETLQQSTNLTWIQVQFLKKAVDSLSKCRLTLKWTYCMAYYLQKNNMTELFEDNQRDLERATEDLSEQLEFEIDPNTIPVLRQKVTDLTVYVERRREIVLSDTAAGFEEGRWEWNIDI